MTHEDTRRIPVDMERVRLMGRVLTHVPDEGDLLTILIKGHLIVEEQLNEALRRTTRNPSCVEAARLRFEQLTHLVKAHYRNANNSWLWGAIDKLNKARNQLAHRLEPENVPELVDAFLKVVDVDHHDVGSIEEEFRKAVAMVAAAVYGLYESDT